MRISWVRLSCVSLVLCAFGGWLSAQGRDEQISSMTELKGPYDKIRFVFTKLRDNGKDPLNKESKEAIEIAAKYFAYRITWIEAKSDPKHMHSCIKDFESDMDLAIRAFPNNQQFLPAFTKEMTVHLKNVFDLEFHPNRVSCVNAAIMLPALARSKHDHVEDFLIRLLKDPKKHEIIKLYACKGLKEFPSAKIYTDELDPTDKNLLNQKIRDVERIEALRKFIEGHDWKLPKESPKGSNGKSTKDGLAKNSERKPTKNELDAVSFIRREAIIALANTQVPAAAIQTRKKNLEGPAVFTLLKVLSKNGLDPAPNLSEKCEAAIGLLLTKPPGLVKPDYQPDLAMYLVGRFLLEFMEEYQTDFVNIANKKAPYLPWRYHTERLLQGMEVMRNTLINEKADPGLIAKYQVMSNRAKPLLEKMKPTIPGQLDTLPDFGTSVAALRPPDGVVIFRSFKDKQPKIELPD